MVWMLLAALHTVEARTNNVATRRHSTLKRGIFKDNIRIDFVPVLFNQQTVSDQNPGAIIVIK